MAPLLAAEDNDALLSSPAGVTYVPCRLSYRAEGTGPGCLGLKKVPAMGTAGMGPV